MASEKNKWCHGMAKMAVQSPKSSCFALKANVALLFH